MTHSITDFRIDIPQSALDALHKRLAETRWPNQISNSDWSRGTEMEYLQSLCEYWRTDFDWHAVQEKLNAIPQVLVSVDDLQVHCVHIKSSHAHAMPLVLTHGWPGSFVEFTKVIGPLTQPEEHGGDPADAFHVICPSIPGYTFSSAPAGAGYDIQKVAQIIAATVKALGYERYAVQGGDWGAAISASIARQFPEEVIGCHLNMVVAFPPEDASPEAMLEGVTPDEMKFLERSQYWRSEGAGYFQQQSTKPQSLCYGLTDSPAGLAGWIVEKFRDWSDSNGDVEHRFSRDEILTHISLYWLTGSILSAAQLYYETQHVKQNPSYVEVPVGCALYPQDIILPPRVWAEKFYNVQQWTVHPEGGHFAASEVPELFVPDVRKFFATLR